MDISVIVEKLSEEFSFYNKPYEYYFKICNEILCDDANLMYKFCYEKVVLDIKNDWKSLKIGWFIAIFKENLNGMLEILTKFGLVIDNTNFKQIIKKYPDFENVLSDLVENDAYLDENETLKKLIKLYLSYTESKMKNKQDKDILLWEEQLEIFKILKKLSKEPEKNKTFIAYYYDLLVEQYKNFVRSLIPKYEQEKVEYDDLVQEGFIGLINAIRNFDYTKGYKFSSYAYVVIKNVIRKYINKNIRSIRIPDSMLNDYFRIIYTQRDYYMLNGKEASEEKLSEILGMSIEKIRNVLMCCEDTISLYDSLGRGPEEAEYTLLCAIKNESSPLPDEIYERKQINLMIEELFSVLTGIQRKVIEQYFGFYNQKPKSIQNIANELGCSRENIDQIRSNALKRMRKHLADKKDNDLNTFSKFSLNTNYFWYNFIGFKKSEVLEAINELVNEENLSYLEQKSLIDRFGKKYNLLNKVDEETIKVVSVAIEKIKEKLLEIRKRKSMLKTKIEIGSLMDILDATFDEIKYLRSTRKKDSKSRSLLNRLFNDDFLREGLIPVYLSKTELRTYYSAISALRESLKLYRKKEENIKYYFGLTLKQILNITTEEIEFLKETINPKSAYYSVLTKCFGTSLEEENKNEKLDEKELKLLKIAISKMEVLIFYYREEETKRLLKIYSYFNIPEETNEKVVTPFSNPRFKLFIQCLPDELQTVTAMRIGADNGVIKSIFEIAMYLNEDEKEVARKCKIGIDLFKTLVSEYKNEYDNDFETFLIQSRKKYGK